ncbi:hypothetical protein PZ78_10895 [Vreelandella venusta]|nr:hypothetical protein PZ78_10895 [Halomonas hydrothermalis]
MMTMLIFLMIFVGITAAWYQIYQMHFKINTPDETALSGNKNRQMDTLTAALERSSDEVDTPRFDEAATRIFGPGVNLEALRIAFSQEGRNRYGVPLLRRKRVLMSGPMCPAEEGGIRARHLRLFKTRLPSIDVRKGCILAVIANCGIVQLLAAMSVYTIHYSVDVSAFAWVNQPVMILSAIWGVVVLNILIFKLDTYLHDLYQARQLNQLTPLFN